MSREPTEPTMPCAPTDMSWSACRLSAKEFRRLSAYIEAETGVRMPPARQTMLEARLRNRLRALGIGTFAEYCKRVLDSGDRVELTHLVDRATTHTTEFFREAPHFEYFVHHALPALRRDAPTRELRVWSAACSSGEEAYSLAMVLADAAAGGGPGSFRILGTDVSHEVLRRAAAAIYPGERAAEVPPLLRRRFLLRSRDRQNPRIRIAPNLRSHVTFRQHNLMAASYDLPQPMDVIFCRNVFIYFDRETQRDVLLRLARHLSPTGYLFLGHTDTIHGLDVPLKLVAPAVYRRRDGERG